MSAHSFSSPAIAARSFRALVAKLQRWAYSLVPVFRETQPLSFSQSDFMQSIPKFITDCRKPAGGRRRQRRICCAFRHQPERSLSQQEAIDRRRALALLCALPSLCRWQSVAARDDSYGRRLAPEEQAAVKAALQKIATKAKVCQKRFIARRAVPFLAALRQSVIKSICQCASSRTQVLLISC